MEAGTTVASTWCLYFEDIETPTVGARDAVPKCACLAGGLFSLIRYTPPAMVIIEFVTTEHIKKILVN